MEGFCRDCGQLHLVAAETQEEADEIATARCDCENEEKWHRLMNANVEMLCGEQSREMQLQPLCNSGIELVKRTCELVRANVIDKSKVNIANSEITITRKNDKIDIKRVKKQTNQMMIQSSRAKQTT